MTTTADIQTNNVTTTTDLISDNVEDPAIVIIGIGNQLRCDDGIGLILIERLKKRYLKNVECTESSGDIGELMEKWRGVNAVIIIDAVRSGSSPGSIIRLDAVSEKLCGEWFPYSTHNYNLADAIELGKFYGNLPPFAVIYGIEGKNFDYGTELSEEIQNSIEQVELLVTVEAGFLFNLFEGEGINA